MNKETAAKEAYFIGLDYYHGRNGCPVNYEKAFKFISTAANAGNDEAMHFLGLMYKNGKGVERNYKLAVDYFYKALTANSSNGYAAFDLGRMYYLGMGVEKDYDSAFGFLDHAVHVGLNNKKPYTESAAHIAGCIMLEKKSYERAASYFSVACEKIPEAAHNMGYLIETKKIACDEDKRIAAAMGAYETAAKAGMVQSMEALGRLYYEVNVVDKAEFWYKKVAENGSEAAKKCLRLLRTAKNGNILNLFFD